MGLDNFDIFFGFSIFKVLAYDLCLKQLHDIGILALLQQEISNTVHAHVCTISKM